MSQPTDNHCQYGVQSPNLGWEIRYNDGTFVVTQDLPMHYTLADKSAIEAIKTLFSQTFTDSEGEAEGKLIGQLASDLIEQTHNDDLFIYMHRRVKTLWARFCLLACITPVVRLCL